MVHAEEGLQVKYLLHLIGGIVSQEKTCMIRNGLWLIRPHILVSFCGPLPVSYPCDRIGIQLHNLGVLSKSKSDISPWKLLMFCGSLKL